MACMSSAKAQPIDHVAPPQSSKRAPASLGLLLNWGSAPRSPTPPAQPSAQEATWHRAERLTKHRWLLPTCASTVAGSCTPRWNSFRARGSQHGSGIMCTVRRPGLTKKLRGKQKSPIVITPRSKPNLTSPQKDQARERSPLNGNDAQAHRCGRSVAPGWLSPRRPPHRPGRPSTTLTPRRMYTSTPDAATRPRSPPHPPTHFGYPPIRGPTNPPTTYPPTHPPTPIPTHVKRMLYFCLRLSHDIPQTCDQVLCCTLPACIATDHT